MWMSYLILTEVDIKNYSLGGHPNFTKEEDTSSKTYRTLNKQKEIPGVVYKLLGGTI